jgi:hypothetical protein
VTSRLGTGIALTFFYSVRYCIGRLIPNVRIRKQAELVSGEGGEPSTYQAGLAVAAGGEVVRQVHRKQAIQERGH